MALDLRMLRRIAGLLNARLPEARLDAVADPRDARGKRWKQLSTLLRAAVVGLVAGCRSTSDVEALTAEMSVPMRRLLKIPRRVYTQSHVDYVAEAVGELFAERAAIRGVRIVEQPATLRHFSATFEILG